MSSEYKGSFWGGLRRLLLREASIVLAAFSTIFTYSLTLTLSIIFICENIILSDYSALIPSRLTSLSLSPYS